MHLPRNLNFYAAGLQVAEAVPLLRREEEEKRAVSPDIPVFLSQRLAKKNLKNISGWGGPSDSRPPLCGGKQLGKIRHNAFSQPLLNTFQIILRVLLDPLTGRVKNAPFVSKYEMEKQFQFT